VPSLRDCFVAAFKLQVPRLRFGRDDKGKGGASGERSC
jgi:hypothetical protein